MAVTFDEAGGYGGAISAAGGLAQTIAQLMADNPSKKAAKELRDQSRRQNEYAAASVDPSHPWNRRLTTQLLQQIRQANADAIKQQILTDNRMRARGYAGTANQSRRDESRSGALLKANMQAGQIAQQSANEQLAKIADPRAAAIMGGNAAQYGTASKFGQQQTNANAINAFTQLLSNLKLGDMISRLFGNNGMQKTDDAFSLEQGNNWLVDRNTPYGKSTV